MLKPRISAKSMDFGCHPKMTKKGDFGCSRESGVLAHIWPYLSIYGQIWAKMALKQGKSPICAHRCSNPGFRPNPWISGCHPKMTILGANPGIRGFGPCELLMGCIGGNRPFWPIFGLYWAKMAQNPVFPGTPLFHPFWVILVILG